MHLCTGRVIPIALVFLVISFSVVGIQTFGSDSSDPTQPMSFPNYSDPLVANWSTGLDSITLTPSIFDSAVIGAYTNNQLARNLVIRASLKMSMTELGETRAVLEY